MSPSPVVWARPLKAIVVSILLYSGLVHMVQPYYFIHSAAAYRVLTPSLTASVMILLPYLHIAIAFCLIVGTAERSALLLSCWLFAVFAVAQSMILANGQTLSCGCFGFSETTVGPLSLSIPILACIACVALLFGGRIACQNWRQPA